VAQANRDHTGFAIRLSSLTSDPILRVIFERAERDYGVAVIPNNLDDESAVVESVCPRILQGGAAESVLLLCEVA
jgi:hypothetical protein